MQVGLIKDTKDCGNTSVSMGLAALYLEKKKEDVQKHLARAKRENEAMTSKGKAGRGADDAVYVAIINCGTGSTKYQLYRINQEGFLSLVRPCGTRARLFSIFLKWKTPLLFLWDARIPWRFHFIDLLPKSIDHTNDRPPKPSQSLRPSQISIGLEKTTCWRMSVTSSLSRQLHMV